MSHERGLLCNREQGRGTERGTRGRAALSLSLLSKRHTDERERGSVPFRESCELRANVSRIGSTYHRGRCRRIWTRRIQGRRGRTRRCRATTPRLKRRLRRWRCCEALRIRIGRETSLRHKNTLGRIGRLDWDTPFIRDESTRRRGSRRRSIPRRPSWRIHPALKSNVHWSAACSDKLDYLTHIR